MTPMTIFIVMSPIIVKKSTIICPFGPIAPRITPNVIQNTIKPKIFGKKQKQSAVERCICFVLFFCFVFCFVLFCFVLFFFVYSLLLRIRKMYLSLKILNTWPQNPYGSFSCQIRPSYFCFTMCFIINRLTSINYT